MNTLSRKLSRKLSRSLSLQDTFQEAFQRLSGSLPGNSPGSSQEALQAALQEALQEPLQEALTRLSGDFQEPVNFDPRKCMDLKEEANFVPCFVGDGIEIEQIAAERGPSHQL